MNKFCDLYMNSSKTDFTIIIDNTKSPANKDVLALQSRYFKAMFKYRELRENRRNVVILDCDLHSFVFVLKLLYGCSVNTDSWNLKSLEELIQMMVIINRFIINYEIEELVTNQFLSRLNLFETEPNDSEYKDKMFHNFSLLLEAYRLADRYHFGCLTNKCRKYFDEHSTQLLNYFEKKCKYPSDLIREIIERETFGVPEIKLFNFVKKLIQKNGFEATKSLLRAIRFWQLSNSDLLEVYSSEILKGQKGVIVLNYLKNYHIKAPARVCHEVERMFTTSDISCQKAFLSRCLSARLISDLKTSRSELDSIYKTTITLAMPTLINHIILNMVPAERSEWVSGVTPYSQLAYFFRIILLGSDGQKTKLRWFLIPSFEINDYYFDAKPVAQIQIFCHKDIVIKSVSYQKTKDVLNHKFLCEYHNFDGHKCVWNS